MAKRTVEIEDDLQERIDTAIDEVKDEIIRYLEENPDERENEDLPDWGDLDYSGALHEIIDGSVPIYTANIDGLWYLYGSEFDEAFDNAGIGEKQDGPGFPMGWKAAAIFLYIEEKVMEWFNSDEAKEWLSEKIAEKGWKTDDEEEATETKSP